MSQRSSRGRRRILCLVIGMATLAVTAGAQDAAVRAGIDASNKQFMAAAGKLDAAAVAALYTPDALVLPPGGDVVKGRDAIQAMWKSVFASGAASVDLTTVEVEGQGPLAYETGTYVVKGGDGSVAERGKYLAVWKKVGTSWMFHRDIWNTSPAPKP